jgi:hypothetical protein
LLEAEIFFLTEYNHDPIDLAIPALLKPFGLFHIISFFMSIYRVEDKTR